MTTLSASSIAELLRDTGLCSLRPRADGGWDDTSSDMWGAVPADEELAELAARLNEMMAQQAASVPKQAGADARDAARYRWLRAEHEKDAQLGAGGVKAWIGGFVFATTATDVDEAIDAAMAGGGK